MLFEVGDKSCELTAVASCSSDQVTVAPVEDFPVKHLFKVLFAAPPCFPSTIRNPAKLQRMTNNA